MTTFLKTISSPDSRGVGVLGTRDKSEFYFLYFQLLFKLRRNLVYCNSKGPWLTRGPAGKVNLASGSWKRIPSIGNGELWGRNKSNMVPSISQPNIRSQISNSNDGYLAIVTRTWWFVDKPPREWNILGHGNSSEQHVYGRFIGYLPLWGYFFRITKT